MPANGQRRIRATVAEMVHLRIGIDFSHTVADCGIFNGDPFYCKSQPSCEYFQGLCLSSHDGAPEKDCPFSGSSEEELCIGWFGSL